MTNKTWNISTITVSGQRIRVAIRPGNPAITPMLLFNGIGASLELVVNFVETMHTDQEVIAFDAPGVGGSSTPLLPFRFPALASLAGKMLDHFGYNEVVAFGVSWGGFLAQQFARQNPTRCTKLILAATCSGIIGVPPSPKVGVIMASPKRYTDPEYAASVAGHIYGGEFRTNTDLLKSHSGNLQKASKIGYYWQLAAIAGWTSLHWLHTVKQPTLVMVGNDDPLIPIPNAQLLAWRLPNSVFHVVDGGHLFMLTEAKATVKIIEEFLA
jgi:poly(3-hydroxyalkanoate) depolymerase